MTPERIGPYPIEREVGRGGMGVVYLGRDLRLDRRVALKVLPAEFAADPERLARFEREAKLVASLNHPNIAGIYGIEEDQGGHRFLALEYVEGETLAERIKRGPLPLDEALDLCRQIALAVEAAHERGVIHRDLKPGNVKITPEEQVKVLDFGLAKGGASTASSPDLTQSPTLTAGPTAIGLILGTAAYMSPEQARGKNVDKRTDIWSFGCVLYECLTGRLAFGGETVSDTIARILEREPDWAALPSPTPAAVRELLHRCLEKDARKRQRDIGDARLELEGAIAAKSTTAHAPAGAGSALPMPSTRAIAIGGLMLVLGAALGIGLWSALASGSRRASLARGPVRLSMAVPPTLRATAAQITPDGGTVVLLGYARRPDGTEDRRARLYTRRLDEFELELLPGTDGVQSWTISPDSRWLAFVATPSEDSSQQRLAKVPVDGSSPPITLTDWERDWEGLLWMGDGDILIGSGYNKKFFRLPSDGGPLMPAIDIDTGPVSGFDFLGKRLPDDHGVFMRVDLWGPRGFQWDQWLLDPRTGKAHRLFENAGNAKYSPTGHIVFTRGQAMMAAPFDLRKMQVAGAVIALPGSVRTANSWAHGTFELSDNGTLLYAPGGRVGADRRLELVDASGNASMFTSERRAYEYAPTASPDGRKVAVVVPNAKGTYETWVADAARPGLARVVAMPGADCRDPVWSGDGTRLAFMRMASDKDDGVYMQRADGAGPPQLVLRTESPTSAVSPSSWAFDGSGLLVIRYSGGKGDILFVPVPKGGEPGNPRVLRGTPSDETSARFSPDGKLVAYVSDESGRAEVYVAAYGADGELGTPLMASNGGGTPPEWAGDSRRLFYATDQDKLMLVTIALNPALSSTPPVVVQDLKKLRVNRAEWGITPDGRLIAIQRSEDEDDITHFDVVLDWPRELRERMAKAAGRAQ